jgi:thioredoxin-like negative regulator of GroEL
MPPDALLFTAPSCPHCATVLQGLNELVKQGLVGRLTVMDVAEHPEQAAGYGVRAAPWLKLGPFTLTGAYSSAELRQWVEWASGEAGIAHYVEHLLRQGGYRQAAAFIDADTQRLKPLLAIVANPAAKIEVRLGASALLEAHANTPALQRLLPQLAEPTGCAPMPAICLASPAAQRQAPMSKPAATMLTKKCGILRKRRWKN